MEYTEEENRKWWDRLAEADRAEIFETMIECASSREFKEYAESIQRRHERRLPLLTSQLRNVRKWGRR